MTSKQRGRVHYVDWPCQLIHVSHGELGERVYHFADIDVPRPDALQPGDEVSFEVPDAVEPYPWAMGIVRVPE